MKQKRRIFFVISSVIIGLWFVGNYWFFFKTIPASGGPISPIQRFVAFTKPPPSPQPVSWTLLLTGDIIPARVTNQQMVAKNDFMWPLVHIADILKGADLTLINLEAPLLTNCPVTNEGMRFCTDARFARSLDLAGVDVANLANNHSLNYGWEGILETEEHLREVGVETTGYTSRQPSAISLQTNNNETIKQCDNNIYCSKLAIKNVQNIKVGFLGYNAVGQRLDRIIAEQEVKEARKQADVLIISVHWGKEYTHEPMADMSLARDDPKELGKLFIDWGADVVAGNHPHWVQYLEWYPFDSAQGKQYKPIIYAQGNTVFDQEWSEETKRGVIVKLYFSNAHVLREKTEIVPIGIHDWGQAYILEEKEKEKVLELFKAKL